jgi:hypothetical protein
MSAAFMNAPDPDPDHTSIPAPDPMPERLRELLRERTPDRLTLDVDTVATVLFVSPFTPREWRQMGPVHIGRYAAGVAADPVFRLPELVALVSVAEQAGRIDTTRMNAARKFARRVVAALSN